MSILRPLPAVFFKTDAGNEPVREWLKDMSKEERTLVGIDIKTVQYCWPVGKPLVDSLGDGLWEIRTRLSDTIARTIFFERDQAIVLLHGFIKKTKKTPPQDKKLSLQRKKAYIYATKK